MIHKDHKAQDDQQRLKNLIATVVSSNDELEYNTQINVDLDFTELPILSLLLTLHKGEQITILSLEGEKYFFITAGVTNSYKLVCGAINKRVFPSFLILGPSRRQS